MNENSCTCDLRTHVTQQDSCNASALTTQKLRESTHVSRQHSRLTSTLTLRVALPPLALALLGHDVENDADDDADDDTEYRRRNHTHHQPEVKPATRDQKLNLEHLGFGNQDNTPFALFFSLCLSLSLFWSVFLQGEYSSSSVWHCNKLQMRCEESDSRVDELAAVLEARVSAAVAEVIRVIAHWARKILEERLVLVVVLVVLTHTLCVARKKGARSVHEFTGGFLLHNRTVGVVDLASGQLWPLASWCGEKGMDISWFPCCRFTYWFSWP